MYSDALFGCECIVDMPTVFEVTKFLILDVVFVNYVFFCVHPWCDFFVVQIFLNFQDSVASHLDVFFIVPLINSTGLAIVAEAKLHCGDFFVQQKVSQVGSFH